jgi:hypothetical protein
MVDELRDRAQREDDPMARSCIDALEEIGIFRVGRADGVPRQRLEYPPAYPVTVLASAKRESLSAALLWAIMRQESAYQRAVRSKAGAWGLLQLLPSTASRLNGAPVNFSVALVRSLTTPRTTTSCSTRARPAASLHRLGVEDLELPAAARLASPFR